MTSMRARKFNGDSAGSGDGKPFTGSKTFFWPDTGAVECTVVDGQITVAARVEADDDGPTAWACGDVT